MQAFSYGKYFSAERQSVSSKTLLWFVFVFVFRFFKTFLTLFVMSVCPFVLLSSLCPFSLRCQSRPPRRQLSRSLPPWPRITRSLSHSWSQNESSLSLSFSLSSTHTDTHRHTHIHTYTHTDTQTHRHCLSLSNTLPLCSWKLDWEGKNPISFTTLFFQEIGVCGRRRKNYFRCIR